MHRIHGETEAEQCTRFVERITNPDHVNHNGNGEPFLPQYQSPTILFSGSCGRDDILHYDDFDDLTAGNTYLVGLRQGWIVAN